MYSSCVLHQLPTTTMKAVLSMGLLLLALAAPALTAGPTLQDYLLLEDGSKVLFADLKSRNPSAGCCIPVNLPFAVSWSSTSQARLFIATDKCEKGFEINSSAYPSVVKSIDICAIGCTNSPCGLEGMNQKGVSTKGGKSPVGLKAGCANANGLVYQDRTCKAVAKADGTFAYRLLCKKDCDNIYKCLEPGFDYSKCPGVGVQIAYASLGQRCGYVQDNKQYVCGGNHTKCENGVCVYPYASSNNGKP